YGRFVSLLFFFTAPAPTEIYTLFLHDALPIYTPGISLSEMRAKARRLQQSQGALDLIIVDYLQLMSGGSRRYENRTQEVSAISRSEEHTSELQSRGHLVCRLLHEKKNRDGQFS